MIVEGLIHFKFVYCFVGLEKYVHETNVYAKNLEQAKNQFSIYTTNAPKCKVIRIEIIENC